MPHAAAMISTERTTMRRMLSTDAAELHLTVGAPSVMKYWVGGADRTIAETEQRIARFQAHWDTHGFGDWGVLLKQRQELIGFCGLHYIPDMQDVTLGYALNERVCRCGYATEICQAVLEYGFSNLNIPLIVAVIWPENVASIALAQKLGMIFDSEIIWGGGQRVVYGMSRDRWLEVHQ